AMPVYGTVASRFNDDGVTALYQGIAAKLAAKGLQLSAGILPAAQGKCSSNVHVVVPSKRARYLAEIAEAVRAYHAQGLEQSRVARDRQSLLAAKRMSGTAVLDSLLEEKDAALHAHSKKLLDSWPETVKSYSGDESVTEVRGRELRTKLTTTSLSGTKVPKVALPRFEDAGEILRW